MNVHPGLLPEFGGEECTARTFLKPSSHPGEDHRVTVHLVDDEFDHGPVVAQWRIAVLEKDTAESLAERVLEVEHLIYPRAVEMIAALNDRNISADF